MRHGWLAPAEDKSQLILSINAAFGVYISLSKTTEPTPCKSFGCLCFCLPSRRSRRSTVQLSRPYRLATAQPRCGKKAASHFASVTLVDVHCLGGQFLETENKPPPIPTATGRCDAAREERLATSNDLRGSGLVPSPVGLNRPKRGPRGRRKCALQQRKPAPKIKLISACSVLRSKKSCKTPVTSRLKPSPHGPMRGFPPHTVQSHWWPKPLDTRAPCRNSCCYAC